jgi:hypothetical protein
MAFSTEVVGSLVAVLLFEKGNSYLAKHMFSG